MAHKKNGGGKKNLMLVQVKANSKKVSKSSKKPKASF